MFWACLRVTFAPRLRTPRFTVVTVRTRTSCLLVALLASGNASEKSAMGIAMNNDSAKKWHQCGRDVRQKEPAPSAEVRRTTPEVVCAPPDMSSYVAGVARARGRASTQSCRASSVPRTATTRQHGATRRSRQWQKREWRHVWGGAREHEKFGPNRAEHPNRAGLLYLQRCLYRRRP